MQIFRTMALKGYEEGSEAEDSSSDSDGRRLRQVAKAKGEEGKAAQTVPKKALKRVRRSEDGSEDGCEEGCEDNHASKESILFLFIQVFTFRISKSVASLARQTQTSHQHQV